MWIFAKDAFLSIVQHDTDRRLLRVRARIEGDIERVFPEAQVIQSPGSEYRYEVNLSRERVSQALTLRVQHIDYYSVTGSIEDAERWSVYVQVLTAMQLEQQRRADLDLDLEPLIPRHDLDKPNESR